MTRIALISDSHGSIPDDVLEHLKDIDEIWHAGDIGKIEVIDQLSVFGSLRAVHGNIDDHVIRSVCPQDLLFTCDGVKVFMTHIGGYPGRYYRRVRDLLMEHQPDVYICGHSHICKIVRDDKLGLLHLNPGACGFKGFHLMRTILLLDCDNTKIKNLRVVELGLRGQKLT